MRTLRTLLLLTLLCLATGCRKRPALTHTGRLVAVSDTTLRTGGSDTVRFGRLRSGEIVVQQLTLRNDTPQPLVIVKTEASCGCTSLEVDRQPIQPGEMRRMELVFDSRGEHGWQFRSLDLHLTGARHPYRFWIEAEVE